MSRAERHRWRNQQRVSRRQRCRWRGERCRLGAERHRCSRERCRSGAERHRWARQQHRSGRQRRRFFRQRCRWRGNRCGFFSPEFRIHGARLWVVSSHEAMAARHIGQPESDFHRERNFPHSRPRMVPSAADFSHRDRWHSACPGPGVRCNLCIVSGKITFPIWSGTISRGTRLYLSALNQMV